MRFLRAVAVILLTTTACTQVKTIPPSNYGDHDPGLSYRVHTLAGRTYRVSRFSVTDSTLVIRSFRKIEKGEVLPRTPFEVPIDSVHTVEQIDETIWAPVLLATFTLLIVSLSTAWGGMGSN